MFFIVTNNSAIHLGYAMSLGTGKYIARTSAGKMSMALPESIN